MEELKKRLFEAIAEWLREHLGVREAAQVTQQLKALPDVDQDPEIQPEEDQRNYERRFWESIKRFVNRCVEFLSTLKKCVNALKNLWDMFTSWFKQSEHIE